MVEQTDRSQRSEGTEHCRKLWNHTLAVRAGRYSVWQLLRLTSLHSSAAKSSRKRSIVQLGREFQHIPRVDDMSADGTSRWPEDNVIENVARLTNQDGWGEQNNQAHGRKLFSLFVRNKLPAEKLDEQMRLPMIRAQDATTLR